MAKQRYVRTSFWTDSYIEWLSPREKLVFLYLLTNESTNVCGIYEISIKRISFETWIQEDVIKTILDKFTEDKRVVYIHWYIYIRNYIKNQANNPSIIEWIKRELWKIPKVLIDELDSLYQTDGWLGGDWSTLLNLTLPNSTKPNLSEKSSSDSSKQDKIIDSRKRSEVNTRGKFWISIRNDITGRNDMMESKTFRDLQNFISDMDNEEFSKRAKTFKNCVDRINNYKLSKFMDSFGKNNIEQYSITEFISKINMFWWSIDDVFKQIVSKDNVNKVLRIIHWYNETIDDKPVEKPIETELSEEDKLKRKETLNEMRWKLIKKIT